MLLEESANEQLPARMPACQRFVVKTYHDIFEDIAPVLEKPIYRGVFAVMA
jgi:hypothetical protein